MQMVISHSPLHANPSKWASFSFYVLTLTTASTIAVILVDAPVKNAQWAVLTGRKITESSNRPSIIGRIVQESFQDVSSNLLREGEKNTHTQRLK